MLRLFAGVLSLLLCQSAAAQWGQSGVKVPKQSDEKSAAPAQTSPSVKLWAKVRCHGSKYPRVLFDESDSIRILGEVKCGTKVAVLAFDANRWRVRVGGKEGYLLEDAIESKEKVRERTQGPGFLADSGRKHQGR